MLHFEVENQVEKTKLRMVVRLLRLDDSNTKEPVELGSKTNRKVKVRSEYDNTRT